MTASKIGRVEWFDLTVPDAEPIREFYQRVTGWESEALDMGDYSDHVVKPPGGEGIGGICHAKGSNAGLPAQWLIYITVADLAASLEQVTSLGGEVLSGPRDMGSYGTIAVIRDPAGAAAALIQPGDG